MEAPLPQVCCREPMNAQGTQADEVENWFMPTSSEKSRQIIFFNVSDSRFLPNCGCQRQGEVR